VKLGSLLGFLCAIAFVATLIISTPREKEVLISATKKIINVVESNLVVLWYKFRGIEPFYIEEGEDPFKGSREIEPSEGNEFI